MNNLKLFIGWLRNNPEKIELIRQWVIDARCWYRDRKSRDLDVGEDPLMGATKVSDLPELFKPKVVNNRIDLMNSEAVNQNFNGFFMACTACAWALKMTIMFVREYKIPDAFDYRRLWEKQKLDPGTASDVSGDYLSAPGKTTNRSALECGDMLFKTTPAITLKKDANEWIKAIEKGYTIHTGALFGFRRSDQFWTYIPTKKGNGHCVEITGIDYDSRKFIYYDSNGNDGEKREGRKYFAIKDFDYLYSGRVARLVKEQ